MAGDLVRSRELFDRAADVPLPHSGWFAPMLELCRTVCDVLGGTGDVSGVERHLDELDRLGLRFRTLLATVLAGLVLFHAGESRRARVAWSRGLEMARETGSLWGAWLLLELAAWDAHDTGDDVTAGRLWGAVDEFGTARGYGRWKIVSDGGTPRREGARTRDPELFDLAIRQGANMAIHEAVDAALASGA
jgi:hypothetical protein